MATTDELLDALMRNCKKPEDLIGENGLLKQFYSKRHDAGMAKDLVGYDSTQRVNAAQQQSAQKNEDYYVKQG